MRSLLALSLTCGACSAGTDAAADAAVGTSDASTTGSGGGATSDGSLLDASASGDAASPHWFEHDQVLTLVDHNDWFRDWFYPLWRDHGGAQVMDNYFRLLAKHFRKNGSDYGAGLNWGEFRPSARRASAMPS